MNKDNVVSLAFFTDGGAGNLFVQMNFIYCVYQYLKDESVRIVVFGHKSKELNTLLMKRQDFISSYFPPEESEKGYDCDVFVHLEFFPDVLMEKADVEKKSPKLHELLSKWLNFMNEPFRRYGVLHPYTNYNAYIYGINTKRNVLNVMDIDGILGMGRHYKWKLNIGDGMCYLSELGLAKGEYITVQRGATPGSFLKGSPKLWPVRHYEKLIQLLKIIYPEKKIVQVGEEKNSERLSSVDIGLLGKTSWEQVGYLLDNAWLHIDGECGMVHFREALMAGPSVVLFGPTPIEFYGYEDNINIRSDGCPHWCARLTDSWLERCARGFETPPCMDKIMPETVMKQIVAWQRLSLIKEGKIEQALLFKNKELYSEKEICIDEEYKKTFLDTYKIYYYERVNIRLDELKVFQTSDDGIKYVPVSDTAAYIAAIDDKGWAVYENYLKKLHEKDYNSIHTRQKYQELISDFEEKGYEIKYPILIDTERHILDGQHRAAWLAAQYSCDYETEVVQIACLHEEKWDFFPFEKIVKGSRILIYGAGSVGESYIRQIDYTGYCKIIALADRKPEIWNADRTKKKRIHCIFSAEVGRMMGSCDYVVIASRNNKNMRDMREVLISQGISHEKIVSYFRGGV